MRIGIDVGGTNTDAVALEGRTVLASVKQTTSEDVTTGIVQALKSLKAQHDFAPADVEAIMLGTTHFINALVEGRDLAPTAALRLGLPATASLPPMVGWPERLTTAARGKSYLAHGGHEFDGQEISPLRPDEIRGIAHDMEAAGTRSIAISSVFSPINDEFEESAAEIIRAELGSGVAVSLSHEIGRVGLLERENATIINAALRELADKIIGRLVEVIHAEGYSCPLFLSQNDGTLMDVEYARKYPVATFASGPTNSMRGAAITSGLETCAVVDVGGTTSDVGVLTNGFPREATTVVDVAGVRTNFRMPDVLSMGIGGGSIVHDGYVGPASVGYRLTSDALVFGGATVTATDIAVAAGLVDLGDASAVAHLDSGMVKAMVDQIGTRVADTVERMRTSSAPLPVVAVGGGSVILPKALPGLAEIHLPQNSGVANAIGAAIAQVSGEVDKVYSLATRSRSSVIDEAKAEATEKAIAAGASAENVEVVEFDEFPIPYLPGNATRIRAKAVGDLGIKEMAR
ncbi:hydantoinase/oxoprolinase N-terminal domain-containing protein [Brevibacterium marinum]|uniref:N-methylhydantoinase A/oxoprolinase/acetone carboxylase beta subunit n=1 Tax=Brevibacterium marinum TaxID=418643 RepID=A0A846S4P0_9MICO|nr:hydantoinase/oxoprolinase family protein [Brevibacterium marinum]NJC57051.1 N-methylhydantoinase A/oxoprolinase/acetone carboxylase beta subunit [Brevibacterium marinum]